MISEIHPLRRNHLAKLAANALFCLKYTCDAAQPVGLGLGLMLGADEILKQANKEPIFGPILGSMLSVVLPEGSPIPGKSRDSIYSKIDTLAATKDELDTFSEIEKTLELRKVKGGLSSEDFVEFKEAIKSHPLRRKTLLNTEKH